MPCGEEEGLGGGDDVLRLGRDDPEWVEYDHDGDRWVPTPKGMQFDDDGLSGYWRQHVEGPHAEHIGVVTRAPYYLLFQFSVAYARSLDFDVRHDPLGAHLSDCAHTAVNYPPGATDRKLKKFARARLIEQIELVHGVVTVAKPAG